MEKARCLALATQEVGRPTQNEADAAAKARGVRTGHGGEQLHSARVHLRQEWRQGVEPGRPVGGGQIPCQPPACTGEGGAGSRG